MQLAEVGRLSLARMSSVVAAGRALDSVLSRHAKLKVGFAALYGDQFKRVRDWDAAYGGAVSVVDVSPWLSGQAENLIEESVEAGYV